MIVARNSAKCGIVSPPTLNRVAASCAALRVGERPLRLRQPVELWRRGRRTPRRPTKSRRRIRSRSRARSRRAPPRGCSRRCPCAASCRPRCAIGRATSQSGAFKARSRTVPPPRRSRSAAGRRRRSSCARAGRAPRTRSAIRSEAPFIAWASGPNSPSTAKKPPSRTTRETRSRSPISACTWASTLIAARRAASRAASTRRAGAELADVGGIELAVGAERQLAGDEHEIAGPHRRARNWRPAPRGGAARSPGLRGVWRCHS